MRHPLVVLSLLCALAACSGESEKAAREVPVRVEGERLILAEPDKAGFLKTAAVEKEGERVLRLPGRLVWNEDRTVRVFPQLGGRVTRILAEVGASVKAGQGLAVLASPDFGVAEAEAAKARADLQLARQALQRNQELLEAGVIAQKDWQQSQADEARARAEAERAGRRMAMLGGEGGTYALKSPLAGVVVERNLNPGQEFRADQPAAPLFVVTDPSSLWVQLDAAEGDLVALKPGERLVIEARQYPGERFDGVIRHVADFVDPATRTVKVRGEVTNAGRRLKGEMFVSARIDLPPAEALRVPAQAVFLVGDRRYVFLEEAPGRYLRRPVMAGPERDGWIEVGEGLKAGDKVVVEGNLHLLKFFKASEAAAGAR